MSMMNQDFSKVIYDVLRMMPPADDPNYRRFMAMIQDLAPNSDRRKFLQRNSDEAYLRMCSRAFTAGDAELSRIRDEASRYLQNEFATATDIADEMSSDMVRAFAACGRGITPDRISFGGGQADQRGRTDAGRAARRTDGPPVHEPPEPERPHAYEPPEPDHTADGTSAAGSSASRSTASRSTGSRPVNSVPPGPGVQPAPAPPQKKSNKLKWIAAAAAGVLIAVLLCLHPFSGPDDGGSSDSTSTGGRDNTCAMSLEDQENWTHYAGGFVFTLPEGYHEVREFTNEDRDYSLQFEYADSVTEFDTDAEAVAEERVKWAEESADYKLLDHGTVKIDGKKCWYMEHEFSDSWWYELFVPMRSRNRVVEMEIFASLDEAEKVTEAKRVRDRLLDDLQFLDADEFENNSDTYYEACGLMLTRFEMLDERAGYWNDTEYDEIEGIPGLRSITIHTDPYYLNDPDPTVRDDNMASSRKGGVTIRDSGSTDVDGATGYWYDCIYQDDNNDPDDDGWEYNLYVTDPSSGSRKWILTKAHRSDDETTTVTNRDNFIESLRFMH